MLIHIRYKCRYTESHVAVGCLQELSFAMKCISNLCFREIRDSAAVRIKRSYYWMVHVLQRFSEWEVAWDICDDFSCLIKIIKHKCNYLTNSELLN